MKRRVVVLAGVVALGACSGGNHSSSAGTAPGSTRSSNPPSTAAARSDALAPAVAATRRGGTADFTYEKTSAGSKGKAIFTATVHGVVDFGNGNTSFGYTVKNTSTHDVTVDEARGVGGSLYVHVPAGYGISGTRSWTKIEPGQSKTSVSVNVSSPEEATALAALLDFLGTATDVKSTGAHALGFQVRTDTPALAGESAAVKLLILGPNAADSSFGVGTVSSTGTAQLDSAGRLARVEIVTTVPIVSATSTVTFTFGHFGVAAPPGAPNTTEIANQATLCADKNVDVVTAIKRYRSSHGSTAQPTAAQLAAAGYLKQPAAWVISYSHEAGNASYFGIYENPWCPGSLG